MHFVSGADRQIPYRTEHRHHESPGGPPASSTVHGVRRPHSRRCPSRAGRPLGGPLRNHQRGPPQPSGTAMRSHPVPCRSRCSCGHIHRLLALSLAGIITVAGSASAQSLSLSEATIADLNAAFDAGSLTSERLVTLYLARIEGLRRRRTRTQRLPDPQSACAGDRAGPGPGAPGDGTALPPARYPGRAQGQRRHPRHADHGRVAPAQGIDSPGRRLHRAEAARGGGDHPGQGEHERVRVGGHAQLDRRTDAQPARPHAHAVRVVRRDGRGHRGLVRPARHRHRHRRVGPRPHDLEWNRRPETLARAAEPRRHRTARSLPSTRLARWRDMCSTWPRC